MVEGQRRLDALVTAAVRDGQTFFDNWLQQIKAVLEGASSLEQAQGAVGGVRLDPAQFAAQLGRALYEADRLALDIFRREVADEVAADQAFAEPPLHGWAGRGLPFKQALDHFNAKALKIAEDVDADLLGGIKRRLSQAIEDGTSLGDFRQAIDEMFAKAGYASLAAYRVEAIYRNNLATAYQAGRYRQMTDPAVKEAMPLWRYVAVMDAVTRPEHAAMHGRVFPADDPIWDEWYPPNGFNCFPEWIKVLTSSGWREIGSIRPEDRVVGGSGHEHLVTTVHRNAFNGRLVRVLLEDCRIDATPNHRVLTMNGWMRADILKAGDVVIETSPLLKVDASVGNKDVSNAEGGNCSVAVPIERESAVTFAADAEVQRRHPYVDPLGAKRSGDDVVVNGNETERTDVLQHEQLRPGGSREAGGMPVRLAPDIKRVGPGVPRPDLGPSGRGGFAKALCHAANRFRVLLGQAGAWVASFGLQPSHEAFHALGGPLPAFAVAEPLGPNCFAALPGGDAEMLEQAHEGASVDAPARAKLPVRKPLVYVATAEDPDNRAVLDRFDSLDDFRAWARLHGRLRRVRSIEFIPYSGTVFNLSVEGDKSYIVRGATVHNCRCDVMAVSAARAEHEGWKVSGPPPRTVESIDKATGEVTQLPVVPDKGWNRLPTLDFAEAADFYDPDQVRDEQGKWTAGGGGGGGGGEGGGGGAGPAGGGLSDRAQRAMASHVTATREVQRTAEASETRLARALPGGKVESDNKPFDVRVGSKHCIEVKTIVRGKNDKITMHPESRARKEAFLKANGAVGHTVVFDNRVGKIFYRAGVGSFRLAHMAETNLKALNGMFKEAR